MDAKDKRAKVTVLKKPEIILHTPDLPEPGEGKAWRRKSDGFMLFSAAYLGKSFYRNGKHYKTGIVEKPEDYELVDIE